MAHQRRHPGDFRVWITAINADVARLKVDLDRIDAEYKAMVRLREALFRERGEPLPEERL